MSITVPCRACGDPVSALVEFLGPVTLCGACTPEGWDGVSLPRGVYRDANPPADDRWSEPDFEEPGTYLSYVDDWDDLLSCPTHPMPYADDGIDVPYEREALDRLALVGDDGRDADGELMDERAEPHTRKDAA